MNAVMSFVNANTSCNASAENTGACSCCTSSSANALIMTLLDAIIVMASIFVLLAGIMICLRLCISIMALVFIVLAINGIIIGQRICFSWREQMV